MVAARSSLTLAQALLLASLSLCAASLTTSAVVLKLTAAQSIWANKERQPNDEQTATEAKRGRTSSAGGNQLQWAVVVFKRFALSKELSLSSSSPCSAALPSATSLACRLLFTPFQSPRASPPSVSVSLRYDCRETFDPSRCLLKLIKSREGRRQTRPPIR